MAKVVLRAGLSVKSTARLATALLVDMKIVTKEDAGKIVNMMKIQCSHEKVSGPTLVKQMPPPTHYLEITFNKLKASLISL